PEIGEHFALRDFAYLPDDAERTDRAGDQDFVTRRLAGFSRDLHAAMIQLRDALAHSQRGQFVPVGTEGVRLDQLRPGLEILLMSAENRFGMSGVQLLDAALRS